MLPFLKKKPVAGLIVHTRTPDEKPESQEDDENQAVEAAASDVLAAIEAKDVRALASALRAAFEICDSYPHEEGEHTNDYDAQNAKAAKDQI